MLAHKVFLTLRLSEIDFSRNSGGWDMKKVLVVFFALIFPFVLMQGCGGGGGSDSSDSSSPSVSELSAGDGLIDLGDLVEPAGDHWYFTEAVGINDNGMVIGSSQRGWGAFIWNPETSDMTPLGGSEAADINSQDEVIVNSIDGEGNFVSMTCPRLRDHSQC